MINLQIETTKNNIVQEINNSGLPVGVALLILDGLTKELEKLYIDTLNNEQSQNNMEEESNE